ncbi:MAG: antibiotic biosynthesis monooxygenase [Deltaproteobacteria bacterium]|nr:antibiotic biosynthesis monooxygenase [Deltaproteobacteria bacterium]
MIETVIMVTMPSEKRAEILQTFKAMLGEIRSEPGCISCNCYVDIEAENILLFQEQWENREDLNTHLRSSHFSVLIGVMNLLDSEPDIRFNTIAATAGTEVLIEARAQ